MKAFGSILCAVAFLAGGCQSVQQRAAQQAEVEDTAMCARLGAAKGSERDFQCRLTLEAQRRNADAMAGAAMDAQQSYQRQQFANRLMFGR